MTQDPTASVTLDDEQRKHWRAFSVGSALLREALDRSLGEAAGLSLPEYELLGRLADAEHHALRMSDLAACLAHSRSRLSHTVGRLERADLVERKRCAQDARGVWCALTERGEQVVADAAPAYVAAIKEHLLDILDSAELAALGAAMSAIRAHLTDQ